eukprot:458771_1
MATVKTSNLKHVSQSLNNNTNIVKSFNNNIVLLSVQIIDRQLHPMPSNEQYIEHNRFDGSDDAHGRMDSNELPNLFGGDDTLDRQEFEQSKQQILHQQPHVMINNKEANRNYGQLDGKAGRAHNYSGTNDDPLSLNHRLKQYNQVLQSELLGFGAQYSAVVNQVFNDQNNEEENEKEEDTNHRRSIRSTTNHSHSNDTANTANGHETKRNVKPNTEKYQNASHHPLCPCYAYSNNKNRNTHSNSQMINKNNDTSAKNTVDCVCDSVTSNVATNFLQSPQRALRYGKNDNEQEKIDIQMTPIKQCSQSVLSGSRKSMRHIAKSPFTVLDTPRVNSVRFGHCVNGDDKFEHKQQFDTNISFETQTIT